MVIRDMSVIAVTSRITGIVMATVLIPIMDTVAPLLGRMEAMGAVGAMGHGAAAAGVGGMAGAGIIDD
jgi:hypothetical protein